MNMDQYIGRLLDNRYEILEVLGTGGMAVVYKARCHRLNRLVAIKILKDEFSRDEEFRRRFHAEGEAVAMLSHPNIVQVYDVSSTDTANYIVMELVDGISLKQYMEKKGVLNWKETLHFAMQIAKGLEHAHSRGIVHRDIKPHNVMVLKNGSVKVMDFGIARIMSKTNTLTKEALGSVHYISPEQAKGGWVDNRSDLYSLGVVMYEMMTGRPPYDGESPVAVAIQHINGGAAMPSTLNPNIPGGMEQIIMKGMALDVKDRYSSATEMLQDMEEFRKNPAILFAFPKPAGFSDATQPINLGRIRQQSAAGAAGTTADRVARARSGETPRTRTGTASSQSGRTRTTGSTGSGTGRRTAAGAAAGAAGAAAARSAARRAADPSRNTGRTAAQRRRSRREIEEEEKRSRIATITIVVCSLVAVIGIGAFLIAVVSGAIFNQETELVEVPDLLGDIYYSGMVVDGFQIDAEHTYNDDFARGQIFEQNPVGGIKIQRGSTIKVLVSLGEEPMEKYMENLLGQMGDDAKSFLTGQGMNPLVLDGGFSDEYEEGTVIRTEPEEGTKLTNGQTVYIYVSQGPMIKTGKMPNLVGLNYATAMKRLDDLDFSNVEPKYVESDEPKDDVVDQSVDPYTEIDLTKKVILYISKGPEPTEPSTEPPATKPPTEPPTEAPTEETTEPTQEPTEPPTEAVEKTKTVTIQLPERENAYTLTLYYKGQAVREPSQILPGTTSVSVELTGSGIQIFDVYINGEKYQSIEVDFSK